MKVVITGATGLAGSEAVRQAILDRDVERITVLSRRPLDIEDPKLDVILQGDFTDYAEVLPKIADHGAVLWCLGISQSKVTRAEYERITLDFAVAAAKAMASVNAQTAFCFLSGSGSDSSEKSRILFARVKGKTENELLRILPRTYCFRPGYINPIEPRADRTLINRAFGAIAPVLRRLSKNLVIDADALARAMLRAAKQGAPKRVLENADIDALAKGELPT